MSTKQQSAVFAATTCAMAACYALSSAALRQKRSSYGSAEQPPDADASGEHQPSSDNKSIWRESSSAEPILKERFLTIEQKDSFGSFDSLASPIPMSPTESVTITTNRPSEQSNEGNKGLKRALTVMAWLFLFFSKLPYQQQQSFPVSDMMLDDHRVSSPVVESPPCLIYDTVVSVDDGFYGGYMGNQTSHTIGAVTKSIHGLSISKLSGVYGPLVLDAPYEVEVGFNLTPVLEAITIVQESLAMYPISLSEGVYGPFVTDASLLDPIPALNAILSQKSTPLQEGVYGPYVLSAPFEFEVKIGAAGSQAILTSLSKCSIFLVTRWLSNSHTIVPQGFYGTFASSEEKQVAVPEKDVQGFDGLYLGGQKEFLEAIAELQFDWSEREMCSA